MKKTRTRLGTFSLCLIFLLLPGLSLAESTEDQKKTAAIMAAENFLLLVDTGQYGQSWDEASALFRSQVDKQEWLSRVKAVRDSLGTLGRREIIDAEYATELPGAPDGEYVIIQYKSSFDRKQNGIETVTPMLDKDGSWRVSGYYIK